MIIVDGQVRINLVMLKSELHLIVNHIILLLVLRFIAMNGWQGKL